MIKGDNELLIMLKTIMSKNGNEFISTKKTFKREFSTFDEKLKYIIESFNFKLYTALFNFVFKDEYCIQVQDLFKNEKVVRNLLKISYKYCGFANEDYEKPNINFFEMNDVKGICVEMPDCEYESQSKYVCFIFNGFEKVYYSADLSEEKNLFCMRYKNVDGQCYLSDPVIAMKKDVTAEKFFEFSAKHFKNAYDHSKKA